MACWRDICADLMVARDAEAEGRTADAQVLFDGAAPDVAYVRPSRRRILLRPWFDDPDSYDEYEDREEPESRSDTVRRTRAEWAAIPWLEWLEPIKITLLDEMMRQLYSASAVAAMATQPHPFLSMLKKEPSGDAYEARIRSWANVIRPNAYGVFRIDGDGE